MYLTISAHELGLSIAAVPNDRPVYDAEREFPILEEITRLFCDEIERESYLRAGQNWYGTVATHCNTGHFGFLPLLTPPASCLLSYKLFWQALHSDDLDTEKCD